MARIIDFFDGAESELTPVIGNISTTHFVEYVDDATYEAANVGSPIQGDVYFNVTDKTVRYYDGTTWLAIGTELDIQANSDDIADIRSTTGTADGDTDMGTYTGDIINDDESAKQNIQQLETQAETNASDISDNASDIGDNTQESADIRTTSGTSNGDTDMGTYTGNIITDNVDQVAVNQELEDAIESISSGLTFQGTWNASTNTPTLVSSVGTTGDYFIVSTAGSTSLDGINEWGIGDWAIFSDTGVWQKIDNSETQFAERELDNLTSTSINVDLKPNSSSRNIGGFGIGDYWNNITNRVTLMFDGANSTIRFIISGQSNTTASGATSYAHMQSQGADPITVTTGGSSNSQSGDVLLESGNITSGANDTGNVKLRPGTPNSGGRGAIINEDGSEGTIGHVWTSKDVNGGGNWEAGGGDFNVTFENSAYTAAASDLVVADSSGGTFTVTLPAAASNTGKSIVVQKEDTSTTIVTIDGNASEEINGETSMTLGAQYSSVTLISDGVGWVISGRNFVPKTQTKFLTDDLDSIDSNNVSDDMDMSNLVIGQGYKIYLQARSAATAIDNVGMLINHDGNILTRTNESLAFSGAVAISNLTFEFVATATTLTFTTSSQLSTTTYEGNSTTQETFAVLSDIPPKITTSEH